MPPPTHSGKRASSIFIGDDTLLFSWKIEDVFLLLKEGDFHLFAQENDSAFRTPHGVFQELVSLGRCEHPMPVFIRDRAGTRFVLTDIEDTASSRL